LRDIGEARIELVDDQGPIHRKMTSWEAAAARRLLLAASILMLALTGALIAVWRLPSAPTLPEMRVEVTTPPSADPVSLAISPDGRTIVVVANDEGRSRLWLRSLGSTSGRSLEGTDGAACPFWSSDGGSIGFFADGKLKRVDVDTGSVRILAVAISCGGTWNSDDTILFSSSLFGPIHRISATGGVRVAETPVTVATADQPSHRFPQFLPDGRHFLYYVGGSPDVRGVYVTGLEGFEPKRLLDADTAGVYAASGHLLFVRQGTLFAQIFDAEEMVLRGSPFPVHQGVVFDRTRYIPAVSASSVGVLVYRAGSEVGRKQFVWFDRSGNEIERIGDPDGAGALDPSLSPDERRVALYRVMNGRPDIWLLEAGHATLSRFTSEEVTHNASEAIRPIWSPDGTHIVFASNAKSVTDLFRRAVAGGPAELLLETDQPKAATDWSTDGRFVLYRSSHPQTGWDIWALPMSSESGEVDRAARPGPPVQVVRTSFDETDGQFSPDGKWIAYQSNETGRFEIYVQPFPGPGARVPISRNGGAQVRWRRDGKELFYVALDNRLMSVPIQLTSNDQSIDIGTPVPLFTTRLGGAVQGANKQQYMVSTDGQRFLMNAVVEEPTSPIVVVLNWQSSP
jgi:Tol biopolymer transport system component